MTTKEQVIQAARDCMEVSLEKHWYCDAIERLYDIAYKAGEKAMQERAAKVCQSFKLGNGSYIDDDWADMCIDAIRALEVSK